MRSKVYTPKHHLHVDTFCRLLSEWDKYTDNDATFCISYPDYEQTEQTPEQTNAQSWACTSLD